MRILMISHSYPPVISGVTLVVQKLARAMASRGHQVTVLTGSDGKEAYRHTDQGVLVVRVHSTRNPFWEQAPIPFLSHKEIDDYVDEFRPDLVHTHDAGLLGLQLARHKEDMPLPVMATCHYVPLFAAQYLTWDGEPHEAIESLAWSYSLWLYSHFDHVVFATATHRSAFTDKGLDVPTTLISNGLDVTRYRPASPTENLAEIEARYDLPQGPRVLFVGRLMVDKEIDVLIRAVAYLRTWIKVNLLVVGRGDDRERLEEIAQEMGLGSQVRFLGFVPEEDMPRLYRTVDCFAIAAQTEVQSLPTLQALATGLPVVAADAMALPELVRHGQNGYLIEPQDAEAFGRAIKRIVQEPALAAAMGQESLEIVQEHSEMRTFEKYEGLYQRIIQQGVPVRPSLLR